MPTTTTRAKAKRTQKWASGQRTKGREGNACVVWGLVCIDKQKNKEKSKTQNVRLHALSARFGRRTITHLWRLVCVASCRAREHTPLRRRRRENGRGNNNTAARAHKTHQASFLRFFFLLFCVLACFHDPFFIIPSSNQSTERRDRDTR